MIDIAKVAEKLAPMPWRVILVLVAISFILANVASTIAGYLVVGQMQYGSTRKGSLRSIDRFNPPAPTSSLTTANIDDILKRNLFNSEGAAKDLAEGDPLDLENQKASNAVKSDLPVKLVGTIYGGDPFSGIALVENNTKRTINSFMVGDALDKDATVREIHREKIIIERGRRLEYIDVTKEQIVRSHRKKKTSQSGTGEPKIGPIATEPPPPMYKEDGFERKEREIQMTQAFRTKLLTTDFTKVLQDAKATPNMVDGELKGFTLTRVRKDSIYEKSGLQNDDIVTEVNGVPLTDTAQAIRLLQSLRNESEIEVRILRGGSPLRFNLNIR